MRDKDFVLQHYPEAVAVGSHGCLGINIRPLRRGERASHWVIYDKPGGKFLGASGLAAQAWTKVAKRIRYAALAREREAREQTEVGLIVAAAPISPEAMLRVLRYVEQAKLNAKENLSNEDFITYLEGVLK